MNPIIGYAVIALGLFFAVGLVVWNKRRDKRTPKEKLDKIKELAVVPPSAPSPPASLSSVSTPATAPHLPATSILTEYSVPRTINIELTRIKNGSERATTKKGRVTLIPRFGSKDIFFFFIGKMGYFIDPSKIIKVEVKARRGKVTVVEKLVYDQLAGGEPLNADGTLDWSWDIEHLLRDSALDQYITVATFESSFQFTPTLIKTLIVVGVLGSFVGLALNGTMHLVPTTLIHWIP